MKASFLDLDYNVKYRALRFMIKQSLLLEFHFEMAICPLEFFMQQLGLRFYALQKHFLLKEIQTFQAY